MLKSYLRCYLIKYWCIRAKNCTQLGKTMDRLNQVNFTLVSKIKERYGLPAHLIFTERIAANYRSFREMLDRHYPHSVVCFALKSNPCLGAARAISKSEGGIDAVSEYELQAALNAGVKADKIICNGNAKSDRFLKLAAALRIPINVDCMQEMELLDIMAAPMGHPQPVLLRFSGMPLDGFTNAEQSTAGSWTKFGFAYDNADELFEQVKLFKHLDVAGISAHIGTQIVDRLAYQRLVEHLARLISAFRNTGLIWTRLDIGGGFPVNYIEAEEWSRFTELLWRQLRGELPANEAVTWDNHPMGFSGADRSVLGMQEWRGKGYYSDTPGASMLEAMLTYRPNRSDRTFAELLKDWGEPLLYIEPGRGLIGSAGITLAEVMTVKEVNGSILIVTDMGVVNHSPSLITADIYPMEILPHSDNEQPIEAFIAGRLCFTGDMISKVKVRLNRLPKRGDILVIHHTGAYCADHFTSNSCGFPRPVKVAVDERGKMEVWRRPEKYNEIFGIEL